jgi:DNA-binding transcriptional MerR regulator
MTDSAPRGGETRSFSELSALIRATDGLSLAQVCSVTGLEPSTVQNWIKRGFVPHPERKRYGERHLARILLIDALREGLLIERVGDLMAYINGNADDTADDLIGEAALYDLFNKIAAIVAEQYIPPDRVRETVAELVGREVADPDARRRIIPAMTVMVNATIAARYKNEADRLFIQLFQ